MILVIARLKIIPGQENKFEEMALELSKSVRINEPECNLYQLCKGETAGTYTFVERYADDSAMERHKETAHFQEALPKLSRVLAGAPIVEILKEISE